MRGYASSRWGHQPPLGTHTTLVGTHFVFQDLGPCHPLQGPLVPLGSASGAVDWGPWFLLSLAWGAGRGLGAQGTAPLCTDGERFPAWSCVGGTVSPGLTQWWGCGLGDLVPPWMSLLTPAVARLTLLLHTSTPLPVGSAQSLLQPPTSVSLWPLLAGGGGAL